MIDYRESPKRVSVGDWVGGFAILDYVLKKWIFLTLSLSICFSSMTVFAWLCFAENIYFFLDQIPGYSTGSITENENVIAAIIQLRLW